MITVTLQPDPKHGQELRVKVQDSSPANLGIDDLGLNNWYWTKQGIYIRPGLETRFIMQARQKGCTVVIRPGK